MISRFIGSIDSPRASNTVGGSRLSPQLRALQPSGCAAAAVARKVLCVWFLGVVGMARVSAAFDVHGDVVQSSVPVLDTHGARGAVACSYRVRV